MTVIEKAINSGIVSVTNNGNSFLTAVKVCSGNNNVSLTLSDSYGNIQWLYSNTPTGSYRSIPEENNTTLVLSNLMETGTVYYYAKVSCSTTVFTNKIAVTVQKSIPGSITGSGTICSGNTKNLILALVGEVGELAAEVQWLTEKEVEERAGEKELADEIADIALYLIRLSDIMGIDLGEAIAQKMHENAKKYPVNKSRGSALKYDKLT